MKRLMSMWIIMYTTVYYLRTCSLNLKIKVKTGKASVRHAARVLQ